MGVCFLWSWFRARAHTSSAIPPPPPPQSCSTTCQLSDFTVICSTALLPDHHLQMCVYLVGLFGGFGDIHINQNDSWKVKGAQRMFTIWAIITDLCPVIEKLGDYWSPRTSWHLGKASSFRNSLACPFTMVQVPAGAKWEDLTLALGKVKSCPKLLSMETPWGCEGPHRVLEFSLF